MYAVKDDTETNFNIVLYIKVIGKTVQYHIGSLQVVMLYIVGNFWPNATRIYIYIYIYIHFDVISFH